MEILDEIPMEEIAGDRVALRPLCEDDAAPLYGIIDDSRKFLGVHLPWPDDCRSPEDVAARLESWDLQAQMGSGACWGVFVNENGAFRIAGCIVLGWIQWTHFSASVSYWLAERFCGKGFATEALRLLSNYAFDRLGLNRLELSVSVTNAASAAVARKANFVEEGKSREFERINGIFEDHLRFAKLARDPR